MTSDQTQRITRAAFPFLALSIVLLIPLRAAAWVYTRGGAGASAVLADPHGNVISAGMQGAPPVLADYPVVVVKHGRADGAEIWRYTMGTGANALLAWSGDGSLIASNFTAGSSYVPIGAVVAKIDAANGQEQWRRGVPDVGFHSLAVDASGDVLAAGRARGSIPNDPDDWDLIVVKFAGSTGDEIWRFVLNGGQSVYDGRDGEEARAVGVDASGDVLVAGKIVDSIEVTSGSLTIPDFLVLKLDGASGQLVWRNEVRSVAFHGGIAKALQVAPNGDLIAAGWAVPDASGWFDIVVARFAALDGIEVWRTVIDSGGGDYANDIKLDAAGDVLLAAAPTTTIFSMMKFAGSSGALLWRHDVPYPGPCLGGECSGANLVAIDSSGDAIAAGVLAGQGDFTVVKVRGADGSEIWRRNVDVSGCDDAAASIAVDGSGDIAVGGTAFMPVGGTCSWPNGAQYAVAKLGGESGEDYSRECKDGRDNDADGLVDYPADPGCARAGSTREDPQCNDGVDNDGDALVDLSDPQCSGIAANPLEEAGCGLGLEMGWLLLPVMWMRARRARASA